MRNIGNEIMTRHHTLIGLYTVGLSNPQFLLCLFTSTAQYLIHQGVVAVIRPAMSSDVEHTQPYFAGFHIPQFAPVATDPTFSSMPANFPYLLRMSPSDIVQCQALVGIIEHYRWTQFALLMSKDDYGINVTCTFS